MAIRRKAERRKDKSGKKRIQQESKEKSINKEMMEKGKEIE